jgi:N utilization substance protein B
MSRTSTRREARERALHLAYECDMRGRDLETVLAALPAPPDAYAVELVRGVERHAAEIDGLLGTYSQRWTVERMPAIDRALLRIGAYVLGWVRDLPAAVVISEAVELAKQYSTENSGRFVNGLLARIAERLRAPA